MSRTYKRLPEKWYRRTRGYKQALSAYEQGQCRSKAIPPDPWDDMPHGRHTKMVNRVMERLHEKGWDDDKILKHLGWKFGARRSQFDWFIMHGIYSCKCDRCRGKRRLLGYSW